MSEKMTSLVDRVGDDPGWSRRCSATDGGSMERRSVSDFFISRASASCRSLSACRRRSEPVDDLSMSRPRTRARPMVLATTKTRTIRSRGTADQASARVTGDRELGGEACDEADPYDAEGEDRVEREV